MTTTWDDVTVASGPRLLPEGTNIYTVQVARPDINERSNRREARFSVTSPNGGGEFEVPLEPWSKEHEDTFRSIVKGFSTGVGYKPSKPGLPFEVALQEFIAYLPTLIGAEVELFVKYKTTTKVKDGETKEYTNQQVYANRLVQKPAVPAAVNAPSFAGTDDIPF